MFVFTPINFNSSTTVEPIQVTEASDNFTTKICRVTGSLFGGILGFSTSLAISIYTNKLINNSYPCMLPTEFLIIYYLSLTGIYKGAEIGSNLANRCIRSNT